ncbi:hypothetical protein P9112_003515 [Eukaryota sp. TZLM1-RC]
MNGLFSDSPLVQSFARAQCSSTAHTTPPSAEVDTSTPIVLPLPEIQHHDENAEVVAEINSKRNENGMSYAKVAMMRCGLGLDDVGKWSVKYLSPQLQAIISKYNANFKGEKPPGCYEDIWEDVSDDDDFTEVQGFDDNSEEEIQVTEDFITQQEITKLKDEEEDECYILE